MHAGPLPATQHPGNGMQLRLGSIDALVDKAQLTQHIVKQHKGIRVGAQQLGQIAQGIKLLVHQRGAGLL